MAAFKSLPMSKLIHLALVTKIPASKINFLTKIKMEFIWNGKNPKIKNSIKNSTLCNDCENGRLKNVNFFKSCKLTMLLDKKVIR